MTTGSNPDSKPNNSTKRETLSETVFKRLQSQILHGELAPGETLPTERTIAENLGINRGAIREALKKLENARLIETRQGGNTRVLDFRATAGLDVIGALIEAPDGSNNIEILRNLVELRVAIQPDMARLAVIRGDESLLTSLRGILAEMKRPGAEAKEIYRLTDEFWEELARHCKNIAYRLILNTLRTIRRTNAGLSGTVPKLAYRDFAHLERIADAVENSDPDAARLAAKERSDLIGSLIHKLLDAADA